MSALERKKKLFEASKILDDGVAQMIETTCLGRPFFFAVGKRRSEGPASETSALVQSKLEKKNGGKFDWVFLFTPSNIPGFMQIDQFKSMAALLASVSSGSLIEPGDATFAATFSYGGADFRWEMIQVITKYLDSIGCANYAIDKGPELERSTAANLVYLHFSLRNASLKEMRIASMALDVGYAELKPGEGGLCGVIAERIELEEDYKPSASELDREIEKLEKKLRIGFVEVLGEFLKKTTSRPS
jgi:hypothetical protein